MSQTAGNTIEYDVAIVGAGLAGSMLAAATAPRGWRVLLVEKDRLPRHKVCGEFLSPESKQTLRSAGLYETVAALAPVRLTDAVLVSQAGTTLNIPLPADAWGVSRYALDYALARAAQSYGADLWEKCLVKRFDRQRDENGRYRMVCSGTGPTAAVFARTIVLASGRNTAKQLRNFGADREPILLPKIWLQTKRKFVGVKAHFRNVQMPNRVELFLFDGGYVGINPIEDGRANVSLLASYEALNRANGAPLALFDAIQRENGQFAERLADAELIDETLCTVAAVDTSMLSRPWAGVACVGDVATMIPPLCGDGMAMALRSAELCAPLLDQFLRGELSQAAWRRRYTRCWHAEFDRRLRMGRLLQWLLDGRARAELLLRLGRWMPSVANAMVHATRGTVLAFDEAAGFDSSVLLKGEKE